MEEQLIGLLLTERDGGRASISHYNTLCTVQSSILGLIDDTDAIDQVLEDSLIQSPTDVSVLSSCDILMHIIILNLLLILFAFYLYFICILLVVHTDAYN